VIKKELILIERDGSKRTDEFVRIGIPFPKGELSGQTALAVANPQGTLQPVQTTVLKQWPDGSLKWLLLDFSATVPADGCVSYHLIQSRDRFPDASPALKIFPGVDSWLVTTGTAAFSIDARGFRPFSRIVAGGQDILMQDSSCCQLDLNSRGSLRPSVDSIVVETEGPLRSTLRIEGCFNHGNEFQLRYFSRLHFFANSSRVIVEFTLHNPAPARHPGGLWDLGDKGSKYISELALKLQFRKEFAKTVSCSPKPGAATYSSNGVGAQLSIYQESSGGKNWQSPLHRNWQGEVPFTIQGFKLQMGDGLPQYGDRALPVVWCGNAGNGMAVGMPGFWQEFPKAIEADQTALKIALFPGCFPDLHELQGGEQKTATVHLDFATSSKEQAWFRTPLTVMAAPELYQQSSVMVDLPIPAAKGNNTYDLIDLFVNGPEEVLAKREIIDEFGWRNFGDIYADHEAFYHKGSETFISHYSNQYDICAGMYRKFFATGIPLWGVLAADLARHLLDIDIYHTDQDREEYNNGLFWHTDHYIPAGLATHRSYSREHLQMKNPLFCGGGPGAEHCYTSGLLLHYFRTGNEEYRQAVIKLATWSLNSLNGSQTVLATLKKAVRYGRQLCASENGTGRPFPHYPMSRGTGNAISACLDAFEAGGGRQFLEQAETLIRGTLHPEDDIDARDLLNAEDAWSYTVLLVSVSKYLDKKCEMDELDDQFNYARNGLLSYAGWMLEHEYPYLEKPEILEYPNETWPAQDLRKSVILFQASRYAPPEKQELFLEKARFFYVTARDELNRHATSSFTRPLALILQNGWIGMRLEETKASPPVQPMSVPGSFGKATPLFNLPSVTQRIAGETVHALRNFNLKKEVHWLQLRLQNIRYSP